MKEPVSIQSRHGEKPKRESLREIKGILEEYLDQGGHWKDLLWQLGLEQSIAYRGDGGDGRFNFFANIVCSGKGLYSPVLKRRITAFELRDAVDTIFAMYEAMNARKGKFQSREDFSIGNYNDLLPRMNQVNKMIREFSGRLIEAERMNRCLYERESDSENRRNLASTLTDPLLIHLLFSQETEEEVLIAIAENTNTPLVVIEESSRSEFDAVRLEIAMNKKTPEEILKSYALNENESPDIRVAAIENESFTKILLIKLKRLHSDQVVDEAVLEKLKGN